MSQPKSPPERPNFFDQTDGIHLITDEPVLFFEENGLLSGTLLYPSKKIKSLKYWNGSPAPGFQECSASALSQLQISQEKGKIYISISTEKAPELPYIQRSALVLPLGAPNSYPWTIDKLNGLLHSEEGLFHKKQVLITYEHTGHWKGYIPTKHDSCFPKTQSSLQTGKNLGIFVIGDSISAGGNCSQLMKLPPFQDGYPKIVQKWLTAQYSKAKLTLRNESVGGTNSNWGRKFIKQMLTEHKIMKDQLDLVIIAFGANDCQGNSVRRYLGNIKLMIKQINHFNPEVEFIIISSSLPNPLWYHSKHPRLFEYERAIDKILHVANKYWQQKISFINITRLWADLLQHKEFYDLTGNGLNHPNDYGHYLYAAAIFQLFTNT